MMMATKNTWKHWLASCNAKLALAWASYMAAAGVAVGAAMLSVGPVGLLLP